MRNIDLAAELGAKVYVALGRSRGRRVRRLARTPRVALDRMKEAFDLLGEYVADQGYDLRFAIEPKPNEPRGDILLPTIGHALAFIDQLERPELVGVNPEIGHEEMAGMNAAAGYAQAHVARQALPHRPQRPERPEVRPGPALRRRQRARRLLGRRRPARRRLRRPGALRLQAGPHRGRGRRVGLGRGQHDATTSSCARRCRRSAPTPRCRPPWRRPRSPSWPSRPLGEGEGWKQLLDWPLPDLEALAARGAGVEHLDQLALEHLYGVRADRGVSRSEAGAAGTEWVAAAQHGRWCSARCAGSGRPRGPSWPSTPAWPRPRSG